MKTKEHLAKHDKQIASIRAPLEQGVRMMVDTRKDLRTIAAMQKQTAANLQNLTASLSGNGHTNGHTKKP